jgi:hypothetical protein
MPVTVDVEKIVVDGDNALLVELADEREVWIPFSQCVKITRRPDGSAQLVVTDWLANKEDLC